MCPPTVGEKVVDVTCPSPWPATGTPSGNNSEPDLSGVARSSTSSPTRLGRAEEDLIEKFAKTHKSDKPRLSQFQQGLFAKLRDRFLNL